jgi:hypothetical protein
VLQDVKLHTVLVRTGKMKEKFKESIKLWNFKTGCSITLIFEFGQDHTKIT